MLLLGLQALASPPSPELKERLRAEGRLQEFMSSLVEARARGINNPERREFPPTLKSAVDPDAIDSVRAVVLLVDFSDNPYFAGVVAGMPADFDSVLFSEGGINPTGSMTEFYLENSYGNFYITGDIYGWYRMPQTYAYYVDGQYGFGDYPQNAQGLTVDAVLAADADVDFSLYDNYGPVGLPDGEVDALFVVHAGPGREETGSDDMIHSHRWSLYSHAIYLDGVRIDDYSQEPEERIGMNDVTDMGVFAHEYGHVLGLPDLYDIDGEPETSEGLGDWSLMAGGSWNNGGLSPAHMDAWSRIYVGFAQATNVTGNMVGVQIPQVESEPVIYRIWANGAMGLEYFLVENRQRVGSDWYLPGAGLLIYHVDDNLWGNYNPYHYHVALEQADGEYQLEWDYNDGDAGDPHPGATNKRAFDDLTVPSSRSYGSAITQVAAWNISNPGSLMTVNLDIEWSRPHFELDSTVFDDNGGDGILDPLETVQFYFYMRNLWKGATNVTVTLSANDQTVLFSIPSVILPSVSGDGGLADNEGDPLEFTVPDFAYPIYDTFFVTVEETGSGYDTTFAIEKVIGKPDILVVDDDRGSDYEDLYLDDLKQKLAPADVWEKATQGLPSYTVLSQYSTVFWFTGDTSSNLLSPLDVNEITAYLDGGGNLFITGQGLANELHNEDSAFLADYLHAHAGSAFFHFIHQGSAGSPVGDGLEVRYNSTTNQDFNSGQMIEVISPALPAFNFYGSGPSALTYEGDYKLVYFNWGYEAISNSFSKYDNRDTVLANILTFLTAWTAPPCVDSDEDGYGDPGHPENRCPTDNCPSIYNPDQEDADYDGIGDSCDNCALTANIDQEDTDLDSIGDSCDNCIAVVNPDQEDIDQDGVGDSCDNCIDVYNPDQADENSNDIGDACEYICGDADGNGTVNILDVTFIVNYLYKTGPAPDPQESADADGSGIINILDVTYLVNYLYKNGPDPIC